jgi:hypothetical protein
MEVARGLGLPRGQHDAYFQRAIKADPASLEAYGEKLIDLFPIWHGAPGELLAFARAAARAAPGTAVPRVLTRAQWYLYEKDKDPGYFQSPMVWREVKETYAALERALPLSTEVPNWFARTASLAGDAQTTREVLARVGDRWLKAVWGSEEAFRKVRMATLHE